jgi:hypothetical protein
MCFSMFLSSQEIHVEVGAVNGGVAPHTLSTGLETQTAMRHCRLAMKAGMALQAQFAPFPPDQHHAVNASMGIVTGDATFNLPCRMFVNEWTVLLNMALRARLRDRPNQIEGVGCAVRIVTIRALHGAFGNPMMYRQSELRLYRPMTGVTKLGLRRFQQAVAKPAHVVRSGHDLKELRLRCRESPLALILYFIDEVGRVTRIARNALRRMFGMIEALLKFARDVAGHATIGVFLCGSVETED